VNQLEDQLDNKSQKLEEAHKQVEKERERAKERISQKEKEVDRYKERLNEKFEERKRFATENLVGSLLVNVRSPLTRALNEPEESDSIRDGVELTLKEFDRVLMDEENIETIAPDVGDTLDRDIHTVARSKDVDAESNTIIEVVEPGFEMDGSVRKKATVFVAK
jgi:molecular chaperone GrpE